MLSLLTFLVVLCCSTYKVKSDWIPPHYTIDMSAPADERWAEACADMKQYAIDIYNNIADYFPLNTLEDVEDIFNDWYAKGAYEPYKSEIAALSQCIGLPEGSIVAINLLYDVTAFCTSIVAENEDGTIIHGRNLDYGFPLLRNDTIVVNMIDKNGNTIYHGTTFFGYVGMWTGSKPNAFTLSGDERDQGSFMNNLQSIHKDWKPVGWLMRDTLQNATDFNDALKMLSTEEIMAPVYYILGGLKYPDGAVITRNQTGSVDVWKLNDSQYKWYLVETNYDHWEPPPSNDDRRDPAIKAMDETGQNNLTATTLYDVLSVHPVLNNNTLYTTIMSASNGSLYNTVVRVTDWW